MDKETEKTQIVATGGKESIDQTKVEADAATNGIPLDQWDNWKNDNQGGN